MRQIDRKYATDGTKIINTIKNTEIPEDEPLILFRGRDELLLPLLDHYKKLCLEAGSLPKHLELLKERIDDIRTWQAENPDRLNVPGADAAKN